MTTEKQARQALLDALGAPSTELDTYSLAVLVADRAVATRRTLDTVRAATAMTPSGTARRKAVVARLRSACGGMTRGTAVIDRQVLRGAIDELEGVQ